MSKKWRQIFYIGFLPREGIPKSELLKNRGNSFHGPLLEQGGAIVFVALDAVGSVYAPMNRRKQLASTGV